MREATGNLWSHPGDVQVITTNGTIKLNGQAVLGRGCAKEALERYPTLATDLGHRIATDGNTVQHFAYNDEFHGNSFLLTFPVKHEWYEKADLGLIKISVEDLLIEVDLWDYKHVVLPRPGCGNGGLSWQFEVKPILEPLLDDRFVVINNHFGGN